MTNFTTDQLHQLRMYSVYLQSPTHSLGCFQDILHYREDEMTQFIRAVQDISRSPNKTVASSFLTRRYGLFISMQFYFLTRYHQIWEGDFTDLHFGVVEEFGNQTIGLFTARENWRNVSRETRESTIHKILHRQCAPFIAQIRRVSNSPALTHWENFFGYLLWHYHVLLENRESYQQAITDLAILQDDAIWAGIADHSLFSAYTKALAPSDLLNTTVRTTCCFSKDVPGLMQCGFCPLKKA